MAGTEVSHGRGGAGNINPDDTKYVDGEVTRAGVQGSHNDGAYSTGRGGAANIGDVGAPTAQRLDQDVVPDAAIRESVDKDYHVGRGGAGNAHKNEKDATTPKSVADRIKFRISRLFK